MIDKTNALYTVDNRGQKTLQAPNIEIYTTTTK